MSTRFISRVRLGAFSQLSGSVLLFLLILAPLAFACTRPSSLNWLSWGLHVVLALWIPGLILERRRPGIPNVALVAAAALIAYVWMRLCLFEPAAVSAFTLNHFSRIYDRWPESIILRTPGIVTFFTSGLLIAFLVATDLSCDSRWRRRLLFTIVGTGCVVVVIGLIQNATHARGIYWETPKNHMPSPFFGPFYHFTSAGAFLNLTWPIAASMALYSFKRYASEDKSLFPFIIWGALSALLLLGHAGHVSRFPQVIAVAVLIALMFVQQPLSGLRWSWRFLASSGITAVILGCAVLWVVARTGRIHDIAARWQMLNVWGTEGKIDPPPVRAVWPTLMRDDLVVSYDHSHVFLRDRGAAYTFASEAIMQRPFFGFGPGGWIAAVSQSATDPVIGTFYLYLQFTHEDFLQTLIEWGLVGGLLWLTLIAGAIYASCRSLRSIPQSVTGWSESSALILGALAGLVAVLVQSLIDFPLQIPANALYACILVAVCWSSAFKDSLSASSTKNVHEH